MIFAAFFFLLKRCVVEYRSNNVICAWKSSWYTQQCGSAFAVPTHIHVLCNEYKFSSMSQHRFLMLCYGARLSEPFVSYTQRKGTVITMKENQEKKSKLSRENSLHTVCRRSTLPKIAERCIYWFSLLSPPIRTKSKTIHIMRVWSQSIRIGTLHAQQPRRSPKWLSKKYGVKLWYSNWAHLKGEENLPEPILWVLNGVTRILIDIDSI